MACCMIHVPDKSDCYYVQKYRARTELAETQSQHMFPERRMRSWLTQSPLRLCYAASIQHVIRGLEAWTMWAVQVRCVISQGETYVLIIRLWCRCKSQTLPRFWSLLRSRHTGSLIYPQSPRACKRLHGTPAAHSSWGQSSTDRLRCI